MTELRKKPLVEAILELRWGASAVVPAQPIAEPDPHYRLLLGRLFDRLQAAYPFHESLPASQMPDALAAHLAQHRFRRAENDWPLVQAGPGILTLNETVRYTWNDFRERSVTVVDQLFTAHPSGKSLQIDQLILRYLDAIELGDANANAMTFLRDKLKINIQLPPALFEKYGVSAKPGVLLWQAAFPCLEPKGIVAMKVGLGQKEGKTAIILDTAVESRAEHVPVLPRDFGPWLEAAHTVTSEWFKELTKGELYASFDPA